MTPNTYKPLTPADFVGDARNYASLLDRMLADSLANGHAALKVLLNGPPGTGKSALVAYLQHSANIHPKWSTTKTNGTKVNMDFIQELENALHYRDLYGAYRLIWIDEADKIPAVAQVRFLTLMDDLPSGVIIAATSNCKLKEFEPRFQSRFQALEVGAVPAAEIEQLLARFLTNVKTIKSIATFACGNVRQALLDAQTALLTAS